MRIIKSENKRNDSNGKSKSKTTSLSASATYHHDSSESSNSPKTAYTTASFPASDYYVTYVLSSPRDTMCAVSPHPRNPLSQETLATSTADDDGTALEKPQLRLSPCRVLMSLWLRLWGLREGFLFPCLCGSPGGRGMLLMGQQDGGCARWGGICPCWSELGGLAFWLLRTTLVGEGVEGG